MIVMYGYQSLNVSIEGTNYPDKLIEGCCLFWNAHSTNPIPYNDTQIASISLFVIIMLLHFH